MRPLKVSLPKSSTARPRSWSAPRNETWRSSSLTSRRCREERVISSLHIALDKKDLKRKRARRLERKARSDDNSRQESRPGKIFAKSRYIPSHVRERVHERANHQCQYRGPDGTRCRSRTGLEIEHQRPFALFRSHDEKYLQLFCHQHNRWSAEKVFGAAFIQEKIDASRRRPLPNGRADSS